MRPRPRLRWLYRPGALPAVEYGEFSDSGNKGLGRRSSSGHYTGGIRRPQHAGWLGASADQPDDAWQRMWHALDTAFGGLPPDLEAEPLVMQGNPGPVLVGAASRDGDRLIVGAGRRGTFGRLRHGRVSRYCLAHAGCPVIAVPSPALNRAAIRARLARVPD
jgi:hypothetical protein